jgi:hypothetical protein
MSLSSADRQARGRFQSGLLAWLRSADDPSGLREMVAVVRGQVADDASNALLWRSAEAFLQVMLDGTMQADDEARQLCRRLERQLGHVAPTPPEALSAALFAWVSNRGPKPETPAVTEPGSALSGANVLSGSLGGTADVLALLAAGRRPKRFDDEQLARWRQAAAGVDSAWHRQLSGEDAGSRAAATQLVAVALELGDASSLCLAEAIADACGLAEDPAIREGAAFRAAMAAALDVARADEGPDQPSFEARVTQAVRRLSENRQPPVRGVVTNGPTPWFIEDAREWLRELDAAIVAVPPKRVALLSGLDWLAAQEACSMIAVRGLARLAHQVIAQVRTDDLDQPDIHALLADTIRALRTSLGELAAGNPPAPDETVFGRLRALNADLAARRSRLSSDQPSQ